MRLLCGLLIGCLLLHDPSRAQTAKATEKTAFDKKIDSSAKALQCLMPSEQTPVTMNAVLVKAPGAASASGAASDAGEIAVVIKARIAPGWHLYAYVPANLPYITTDCLLQLPAGLTAVGAWQKSASSPSSTDAGVFVWEQEVIFIRKIQCGKTDANKLKTGLSYQTCNIQQCLPPTEKWFELTF